MHHIQVAWGEGNEIPQLRKADLLIPSRILSLRSASYPGGAGGGGTKFGMGLKLSHIDLTEIFDYRDQYQESFIWNRLFANGWPHLALIFMHLPKIIL